MEEISTSSFEEAITEIKVVYGAIKAAGVYPRFSEYEDYVQEGLITFAKMIDELGWTKIDRADLYRLAFKKIMWQTIDHLRKVKHQAELITQLADNSEEEDWISQEILEADLELLLQELKSDLTENERLLLEMHVLAGFKLTELVKLYSISYRTLSRSKVTLCKKILKIADF